MVNQAGVRTDPDKVSAIANFLVSRSVCWDEPQRHEYDNIRHELSQSPVLALFDPHRPTTLSANTSSYGLRMVLLQQQENREWKPVAYASKSMTQTEQRYTQIEKEALAITWACD